MYPLANQLIQFVLLEVIECIIGYIFRHKQFMQARQTGGEIMKKHQIRYIVIPQVARLLVLLASLNLSLTSCEGEKTTILYGKVTDQNKQPVDSILVIVNGVQFTKYTYLDGVMTDKNGEYTITITSQKYSVVNVGIPYWPYENPKFQAHYKWYNVKKNGAETTDCCFANTDEKTNYDFELISK